MATHLSRAGQVGIGFRARKGGAIVVAVEVAAGAPRILLSTSLNTHAADDRLSLEPYRVAGEMARDAGSGSSAQATAAVAEGRRRQDRLAAQSLQSLLERLEKAGRRPAVAALLVNRAGWIIDLVSYSLAWAEHVPVAELLSVRQALRSAFHECGLDSVEQDEKSLLGKAADRFRLSPEDIEKSLKDLGASAGKPWRKEQKLACLAAWLALAGSP